MAQIWARRKILLAGTRPPTSSPGGSRASPPDNETLLPAHAAGDAIRDFWIKHTVVCHFSFTPVYPSHVARGKATTRYTYTHIHVRVVSTSAFGARSTSGWETECGAGCRDHPFCFLDIDLKCDELPCQNIVVGSSVSRPDETLKLKQFPNLDLFHKTTLPSHQTASLDHDHPGCSTDHCR